MNIQPWLANPEMAKRAGCSKPKSIYELCPKVGWMEGKKWRKGKWMQRAKAKARKKIRNNKETDHINYPTSTFKKPYRYLWIRNKYIRTIERTLIEETSDLWSLLWYVRLHGLPNLIQNTRTRAQLGGVCYNTYYVLLLLYNYRIATLQLSYMPLYMIVYYI